MRFVTRIHLSDCGWREAFYPGTTIDFRNPRTGRPEHTVFSLENTGGKTSFLALVLSCFDPHEKRFLKTLIRPNQKFGDYFGNVPAFILVEWDLSGGQESLLEPLRLVTGQVVVPRGEGRERELDRHFFAFRTARSLALESIPAPGLEGFDQFGRLNGHRDVTRWLHEMRSGHPGNFQNFAKHKDWKRRLAEEKIDTELLARQVDFNRSEGGIEDFLNFRNESQFVRMFLSMTVPDSEAVAVRGVLEDHVRRLSDLPQLQRRRDALRELAERFAPFVETADEERSAREELARRNVTPRVFEPLWRGTAGTRRVGRPGSSSRRPGTKPPPPRRPPSAGKPGFGMPRRRSSLHAAGTRRPGCWLRPGSGSWPKRRRAGDSSRARLCFGISSTAEHEATSSSAPSTRNTSTSSRVATSCARWGRT